MSGSPRRPTQTLLARSGYVLFAEMREGLSKPLGEVIDRISLLGHTAAVCEQEFEYLACLNGFDVTEFSYQELRTALIHVDVNTISADYGEMGEDFGKFFRRQIYDRVGLAETARNPGYAKFNIAEAMENLSPYTILRLLSQNPKARGLLVTWQFIDVEEGGWARRSDFVGTLDQKNRFLIVTEGSSDSKIIAHAFKLLKPHVADFFDFVDMEDGYPFTGTGNVYRFLQGLISISIMNNVLVIYDNDSEGVAGFDRSRLLNVPNNIQILKLPDNPAFEQFETIGPNGRHLAEINGLAAAIECYLDLGESPLIRWNNFNTKTETYQGELLNKTRYMRDFLDQETGVEGYDYSRISSVLDMIIETCTDIREAVLLQEFEEH